MKVEIQIKDESKLKQFMKLLSTLDFVTSINVKKQNKLERNNIDSIRGLLKKTKISTSSFQEQKAAEKKLES